MNLANRYIRHRRRYDVPEQLEHRSNHIFSRLSFSVHRHRPYQSPVDIMYSNMLIKNNAIRALLLLEAANISLGSPASSNTAMVIRQPDSSSTMPALHAQARGMSDEDHHHEMEEPKSKPWLGYYDFLITEGSYKFWVVFELFTVALLIYSAFAALYYAKYTVTDYDYADYLFKKRSARSIEQEKTTFLGLSTETYLRILEAIYDINQKFS